MNLKTNIGTQKNMQQMCCMCMPCCMQVRVTDVVKRV